MNFLSGLLLVAGCHPTGETVQKPEDSTPADSDTSPTVDSGDDLPIRRFDEVIQCTENGKPDVVVAGQDLVAVPVKGPRALCNDGSRAVMYVAAGSDTQDWVLVFEGGGSCRDYEKCTIRWCTNWFRMGTGTLPAAIEAHGILSPAEENHFSTYNRVFGYYCSSDMWVGSHDDAVLEDPAGVGEPFRISFHGRDIQEAIFSQLKAGVSYVDPVSKQKRTLPSLNEAAQILVAGSSSGSTGLRFNLDRIAASLPGKDVRGVLDGSVNVDPSAYMSPEEYVTAMQDDYFSDFGADYFDATMDESCLQAHGEPEAWRCADPAHVVENHLTTPFFVHMDLGVLAHDYPGDALWYAQTLWQQMAALQTLPTTSEDPISMVPGLFLASCHDHTSIQWDQFLQDRVQVGEHALSFHDVLWNWAHNTRPDFVRERVPRTDVPSSICGRHAVQGRGPPREGSH